MIEKLHYFLNPMLRLGLRKYSIVFPFLTILITIALIEIYVMGIAKDPSATGLLAIFFPLSFIIYFSFRDGMRGGFIVAALTIAYYLYIVFSRTPQEESRIALETTLVLGAIYLILVAIIGGLKQKIDNLLGHEQDERRRLQAIVDQLPVGVLITDSRGNITQGNKKMREIFGTQAKIEGRIGEIKDPNMYYNNRHVAPSQWPIALAISSGKSIKPKEFVYIHENKSKTFLQISASPIFNRNNKLIAAVSVITDITSQKEHEERKDDFVNMASHELKTPLTSMKLFLQLMLKHAGANKDTQAQKLLKNIQNQTERLQELVNGLLDVSRLQTGKLTFKFEKINFTELVEETVEEMKGSTKQQQLILEKKVTTRINGDRFRLYQVITNIINNAIKYSPKETAIVVKVKKEKGNVVLSIKDQGMGIDKEQQKKIFERLYQVSDPTAKTYPGLGMGLYISSQIIKAHKGNIWVESEKGQGSTFFISFPLIK